MPEITEINYEIKDLLELNLSYMPFINHGSLFIPTAKTFFLNDKVLLTLSLPTKKDSICIEGAVIWITPKNALHHVISGIGIQFTGVNALLIRSQIEELLDKTVEVGGYTYGITEETQRDKSKA